MLQIKRLDRTFIEWQDGKIIEVNLRQDEYQ